jgi:hypothetical protein
VIGGSSITKKIYDRGHLTGRETLYHNTNKKNIKGILDTGLDANRALDPNNLTHQGIKGITDDVLKNKVYFARNKTTANSVGQAAALYDLLAEGKDYTFDPIQQVVDMAKRSKETRQTLKAKVPTWTMKELDNPELGGTKDWREFLNVLNKRNESNINWDFASDAQKEQVAKQQFKMLGRKGTATLEGNVGPEYFKNSDKFKRLTIDEFKKYIKANPRRFLKGTAGAVGGLTLAGLGAKMLYDNNKPKK